MFKALPSLRLLAFPALIMGTIQALFGGLSLFVFDDKVASHFFLPALITMLMSLIVILSNSKNQLSKINYRESLLYVSLTWVMCGVIGAIPIKSIEHISFTDSVFESISALTTTGATILTGLDEQPRTFLMYRQFLQWLGGLGVVIFVVAVLPMLNVGGMKILRAETPGPMKDEKLAPRVAHSAQYLWFVYVAITLLCCLGYRLASVDVRNLIRPHSS